MSSPRFLHHKSPDGTKKRTDGHPRRRFGSQYVFILIITGGSVNFFERVVFHKKIFTEASLSDMSTYITLYSTEEFLSSLCQILLYNHQQIFVH